MIETEPAFAESPLREGANAYEQWRNQLMAAPEFRQVYDEEAAKSELWLQLVEARRPRGRDPFLSSPGGRGEPADVNGRPRHHRHQSR